MSRLATVTRLRVAELLRQPLTLVMLLVLPPVVIEMYGVAVNSFPQLPTLGADPFTVGRMTGTLFSVAFLAGLVILFRVISARSGDERAAIAGFPRWELLTTRLVTMLVIAVAGAAVAFATLSYTVDVAAPVPAFGFLVLAALVYGLIGVTVGTVLPQELEGSIVLVFVADIARITGVYLILFGSMIDLFIFQNPLATDPPAAPRFLPGHYPLRVAMEAGFTGSVELTPIGWTVLYLGVLTAIATGAFYQEMRVT